METPAREFDAWGCWVVAKSGDQKEIWKRFNNNNGPRV